MQKVILSESIQTAKDLSAKASAQFSDMAPEDFQDKYMSPYERAVTGIQKREFEKKARQREQQRASMAAKAGAMGGSRDVLERMLGDEATQRGLSDIEATGLQAAYDKGLQAFRDDQTAARAGAGQLASLAQQEQAQGLTGLGTLQTAGEARRALAQQPLDIAYEEFGRQQMAPKQALQEMSGILRGVPVTPSTYQTTQQYQAAPTLGQQLLTAGSVAGGISAGLGKNFFGGKKEGGIIGFAPGGRTLMDSITERTVLKDYAPDILNLLSGDRAERDKRILERKAEAERKGLPERGAPNINKRFFDAQKAKHADQLEETSALDMEDYEALFGQGIKESFSDEQERLAGGDEIDAGLENIIPLMVPTKGTLSEKASGPEFKFDFEAALPYFVLAAKAQEGGGPKGTTDALIAFGKMKGDQESAKYKKSMAEYQKALAEYTKEKATIDYAKLSAKQLNEEFNREAELAKILTDQLNDPLSAAGKSREILKAELIRSKQRMRRIQSAITGQPQSKATVKRDTK